MIRNRLRTTVREIPTCLFFLLCVSPKWTDHKDIDKKKGNDLIGDVDSRKKKKVVYELQRGKQGLGETHKLNACL